MTARTFNQPHHPIDLARAALIGAIAFALLCLLLWATAAADALPAGTPGIIRDFTPAAGIARLVAGLFWALVAGGLLSAAAAMIYNRLRRAGGHRPAH